MSGAEQTGIFRNVLISETDKHAPEMRACTDEANACCLDSNDTVTIIKK